MEASSAGKRENGSKEVWIKYWARLGCWISPCYGPFSLGARFETYELLISLILFFSSHGKPRITKTANTESAELGTTFVSVVKSTAKSYTYHLI
jgi:hypothetical protein